MKALAIVVFAATLCVAFNSVHAIDNFVGVFLDSSDVEDYIKPSSATVSAYGGTAVNLIVDWNKVEPQEGVINIAFLQSVIHPIKEKNLYVILRVYANRGKTGKAIPVWLETILQNDTNIDTSLWPVCGDTSLSNLYTYTDPETKITSISPFPWSKTYQDYMNKLITNLNTVFKENPDIKPDAYQIAAGGEYGEQGLWLFPCCKDSLDKIRLKLEEAEKRSVDHHKIMQPNPDLIMMFESLNGPDVSGTVSEHAIQGGYNWLQSNAGFYQLTTESWRSYPLEMMRSFHASYPYVKFIVEDEKRFFLPMSLIPIPLIDRFNMMKEIETNYGITFSGVTLHINDFTPENQAIISSIASHIDAKKPFSLTVSLTGNGTVNIGSNVCASSSCTYLFRPGIQVTLTAVPDSGSLFTGWSGDCITNNDDCQMTMDTDRNVASTFIAMPPLRLVGAAANYYYQTFSEAYASTQAGSTVTIQARSVELQEDIDLNSNVFVSLKGGYDNSFTDNKEYTTLSGILTVSTGSLIADNLIVR